MQSFWDSDEQLKYRWLIDQQPFLQTLMSRFVSDNSYIVDFENGLWFNGTDKTGLLYRRLPDELSLVVDGREKIVLQNNLGETGVLFVDAQGIRIGGGTSLQRPISPDKGDFRFNSDINNLEFWDGTAWRKSGITPGSISGSDIAPNSITGTQIANGSLTGADIAPLTLNGTHIQDGSVSGVKITDGTIAGIKLQNNSIELNKFQSGTPNTVMGYGTFGNAVELIPASGISVISGNLVLTNPVQEVAGRLQFWENGVWVTHVRTTDLSQSQGQI